MRKSWIPLAMLLGLTATAAADPKPATAKTSEQMVTDDCTRAHKAGKQCVINIESEAIGGETPSGEGVGVAVLKFGNAGSLIRIRRDFIPEIVKSAEDL